MPNFSLEVNKGFFNSQGKRNRGSEEAQITSMELNQATNELLCGDSHGSILVIDLKAGSLKKRLQIASARIETLSVSTSGLFLCVCFGNGVVWVLSVRDGYQKVASLEEEMPQYQKACKGAIIVDNDLPTQQKLQSTIERS